VVTGVADLVIVKAKGQRSTEQAPNVNALTIGRPRGSHGRRHNFSSVDLRRRPSPC